MANGNILKTLCLFITFVMPVTAQTRSSVIECTGVWTRWYDLDNPSGNGDFEGFSAIPNPGGPCVNTPSLTDARVVTSKIGWQEAGENVTFTGSENFECRNLKQTDGACLDYEVRFCCTWYFCDETQLIKDFIFPPTGPLNVSYSVQSCQGDGNATITCASDGRYDLESFTETIATTPPTIQTTTANRCSLTPTDVTVPSTPTEVPVPSEELDLDIENFTDTSLVSIQIATANVDTLAPEVVTNITDYLTEVSELDVEFSENQVTEVAEISSNLVDFYKEYLEDSDDSLATEKQDLVVSISKISRKLNLPDIEGANFTVSTKYVNIEVQDVTDLDSPYTFESTFKRIGHPDHYSTVPMVITIPVEAFQEVTRQISSSTIRVVSVGFRSSILFPSERKTNWVISCSLGNSTDSIEGISLVNETVDFTNNNIPKFRKKNKDNCNSLDYETEFECVYWDFELEDWSSEGCHLRNSLPATCQCDHLTNFAVLVSRSELPPEVVLTIVTYVGCGISVICLLLTLLLICLSEKLRSKYPMKILGNICFCLAAAFTFFIFGIDALEPAVGCSIITVFMHFFFLSAWLWTSVYSYIVYRDIVKVIASYGQSFRVRYAAVIAYGIPLIIVAMNASIALGHVDKVHNYEGSSYRAQNFCWLHEHSLYFGFLLVVGILLLFNFGVFCVVIPRVTCRRRRIQSSQDDAGIGQNAVTVVALVTTMGLSWIFGYLMLVSDNCTYLLVMSWLFTIVNSFQGVFIFYFTAVRSGELVRLCTLSRSRLYSVTTNSSGLSIHASESTISI